MSLTEQQRSAVTAAGSVAVTAGAGTGKTHMLTERYLHHLTVDGLRPLQLAAATFTEAAAAELRGRVRARLRQMPDLAHLAIELEAAQIGTLHSLAGRICREHPEAAGVPWDFVVQDELQQRLWLERHLFEAVNRLPVELVTAMPFDTLTGALRALLADPFTASAALAADPDEWPDLIRAEKERVFRRISNRPEWCEALRTLESNVGPDGDKLELQRRAALAAVARLSSGDFAAEAFAVLDGLSRRPGSARAWGETVTEVKEACGTLKECYRSVKYAFELTLGPADERLRRLLVPLGEAYRLVDGHLREAKRIERLLDFNDLELHALRALGRAAVRDFYRRRWKAILVDEFQDTNPVQAELLSKLSGLPLNSRGSARLPEAAGGDTTTPPAILTVVGDEKQSIYGFRRADLGVFREVRAAIESRGGDVIELSTSFRTHQELMAPLNQTFEPALEELHQALSGARGVGPGAAPYLSVQLLVSEERVLKQFRQRAEAHAVGELIEKLLRERAPVHDKTSGELRPASAGDIAILARSWDTLGPYGDELAARGIPTIHAGGGDLLAQREAKDALALLRFLADPADDLSLAAVLRGPFFALSDRRLLELSAEARALGGGWWEALAQHLPGQRRTSDPFSLAERDSAPGAEAPGTIGLAAATLGELLRSRGETPTFLLRLADDLTGYTAVIANLPGGRRRLADWRGFCDFVGQLEKGQEDVFTVVRELRLLSTIEVKVPRPGMEAIDAVSLMSVHNAKGLEWPIVIIPDITASGSRKSAPTLFEAEAGVAFKVPDEETGEAVEPALYTMLRERRKEREAEEELRVLYVALTRARDRVVLSGSEEKGGRLRSLSAGLEAAGIEPCFIPFDDADAVPKTPRPEPAEAYGERLLGDIGPGLFELPVTSLASFASCPKRFRFEQVLQHPGVPGGSAEQGVAGGSAEQGDGDGEETAAGWGTAARIGDLTHKALQFGIELESELAGFDPTLEPVFVRRALDFANAFRRSPAFERVRQEILRRELPLSIDGKEYGSRLRLHGIADAVGSAFVLDYKTGERDSAGHRLQVAVYAQALGLEQAYIAYLRDELLVSYSAADLRSAQEEIGRILRAVELGELGATPSRQTCRHCPFERICEDSALKQEEEKATQTT